MFKPCIIIPVYNHPQKISTVVEHVLQNCLPCIIIDDGSNPPCRDILENIARNEAAVILLRFASNRGKGAAVCEGLRTAYHQGYTHALQVDADGQHDLDDVSKFITVAEQYPDAVVTGVRVARNAPLSRRLGRVLTDVWVWINTLSFSIKDSMCGYRLYPLSSTISLLDKAPIGERMDFDTDILVRLSWEHLDIKQISTQVVYNDNIPSHFDVLGDNVRISRMHARLFYGMLVRFPRLIMRRLRPGN